MNNFNEEEKREEVEPEPKDAASEFKAAEEAQEPEQDSEPGNEDEKLVELVDRLIQLTVDGRKVEVPESVIFRAGIRALQKETNADRQLELAVEAERQAKESLKRARGQL